MNEITLPDGTTRVMGNIIPTSTVGDKWPVFGSVPQHKRIPRSEWDVLLAAYDNLGPDHPHLPPVHDQNGVGQCNADSTTACLEFRRSVQGLPYQQLSAADLYSEINWGRDGGSLLEDAMAKVMAEGVGLASTSGTIWKNGNWKGKASKAERGRFRVLEAFICPTFDDMYSAVLQGFAISTGIMWRNNYTPGADGWLPRPGGGAGGHAIFGYKPTKRGNDYGIWHQNSWGESYGLRGRFVIPEWCYDGNIGGWWAIGSVVDEGV